MVRGRSTPRKLSVESLYDYALRALGRRSITLAELRAKLDRRCAAEDDVEEVVSRLLGYGYLDDKQVAESHSSFRRDHALVGQKRVLTELRRRGVDESLAERAVADAYEDFDESEVAREFLRRKLGTRHQEASIDAPKEILRLYRALVRAGFGASAIIDALQEVSSNEELLDRLAEALATGDP